MARYLFQLKNPRIFKLSTLSMSIEKEYFLRSRFVSTLQKLHPHTPPLFGTMNVQQMVEHFAYDSLQTANGRKSFTEILTPADKLPKVRAYMLSDNAFKEGIRNPLMSNTPGPLLHHTLPTAISVLQEELIYFFRHFENNPTATTRNPFFGDLNFEENVHLLHKHALHHLRQFGLTPPFV
jgi:hypothetical protein